MRALLVVNPKATTTTPRARDVLVSALSNDLKVDVVTTTHRGHAAELGEQARRDGLDAVVVLGGDGTVNELINGLLREGVRPDLPALGIVPGGSTNVFARALGLPIDPVEATGAVLAALRGGQTRKIGLGLADDRYFTFTAGLGLDADAVRVVELARARGRRSTPALYASSALRRFFRTDRRHPALTLRFPEAEPVEGMFMAVVSNAWPWTYIGDRPVVMTTTAAFEAGLDVVALRRMRTVPTLLAAARMLTKGGIGGRSVCTWPDLGEVTVTASVPQPFQLDGDYLGVRESVCFRSVPGALRLIAVLPEPAEP